MSTPRFLATLMIIFFLSLQFFVFEGAASSSEDAAELAISNAQKVLSAAYTSVLDAEKVGANVSILLGRLSVAGDLLAKAQVAYRLGSFTEAVQWADLCYETGGDVKNDAYEMMLDAQGVHTTDLWVKLFVSFVAVIAVVFGSFLGWRVFKDRYYRRVLGMKPEVAKDEP